MLKINYSFLNLMKIKCFDFFQRRISKTNIPIMFSELQINENIFKLLYYCGP